METEWKRFFGNIKNLSGVPIGVGEERLLPDEEVSVFCSQNLFIDEKLTKITVSACPIIINISYRIR